MCAYTIVMKLNFLSKIGFFILILVFHSCRDCSKKTKECPVIPKEYWSLYAGYTTNDSIIFENNNGIRVKFIIYDSEISPYVIQTCMRSELGSCVCESCHEHSSGILSALSQDTLFPSNYMNNGYFNDYYFDTHYDTEINKSVSIGFTFLQASGSIQISPEELNEGEEYIGNYTANGMEYQNVYSKLVDSTYLSSRNEIQYVSKLFMSKDQGIISFFDQTRNSWFHLSE